MKLYQVLILSLVIHTWIYLLALIIPAPFPKLPKNQEIEIVYQNENHKDEPAYFFEDYSNQDSDALIDQVKQKVKRLSKLTRRVQEEVQALKTGPSQNQPLMPPNQMPNSIQKSARNELSKITEKGVGSPKSPAPNEDPERPSISAPINGSVGANTRLSDSSISNYIPDVKMGGFTSLNSDQFIYYTFYARTNEQIRNRWINNLRQFLYQSPQTEINRLASRPQSTQLEVILNPQGQFVKALVHQRSENLRLDESAISAFRLASPLNNPPEEMIEADGMIHLHYIFTLHFKPSYIASGSK